MKPLHHGLPHLIRGYSYLARKHHDASWLVRSIVQTEFAVIDAVVEQEISAAYAKAALHYRLTLIHGGEYDRA